MRPLYQFYKLEDDLRDIRRPAPNPRGCRAPSLGWCLPQLAAAGLASSPPRDLPSRSFRAASSWRTRDLNAACVVHFVLI